MKSLILFVVQVIPTYYDQNGTMLMAGNLRGVGNGGPVRLVSPAPVIINSANGQPQPPTALRLLPSQVIFSWVYVDILLYELVTE